ncbi:uncharacterized protein PG998_002282 [Apiospora kogelbergensis]|uniref:uncharacterized protein n=1 Tax=Apiospora kogelbergensis TaxID=1337665 RepID=UPI0031309F33
MQITHFALSLFAAAAAAQSSSSNSTDLSSTVAQLPKCALKCYRDQSNDVGCSPGDFSCICGPKRQDFLKGIAVCLTLGSSCSSDDLNNLAPKICQSVSDNPSPSEVAKASAAVTSAVAAAAPTQSDKSAAMRSELSFGVMGAAAAVAALAL